MNNPSAKRRAKEGKVKRLSEYEFEVYTNQPPEKNKANQAVVELLAGYFDVPKGSISILAGHSSRSKIVEVISPVQLYNPRG